MSNEKELNHINKALLNAKEIFCELDKYKNDNDKKYNTCFLQISNSIENLLKIDDYANNLTFNALINNIDQLYECSKTLISNMKKGDFIETENTIYFKFIRDLISHPDGINNKKYLENEIYKEYINQDIGKIIYKEIYYDMEKERFFQLPSMSKRMFNEKSENEFGLLIDLGYPKIILLICPYDKLFDCITDVINQLKVTYLNLSNTVLKEEIKYEN